MSFLRLFAAKGGCPINIAELFVNLGIKGDDKAIGSIGKLEQGLKKTASTSLEAKAAIVGAMYALEKLFSESGHTGTELTNFNALMGGGMVQTLQRYQYAARQVGVSNQEVESTFKTLTATMTKMFMGEGAPKGLARVSEITKKSVKNLQDAAAAATKGHPEVLLGILQDYAQQEKNAGLSNEVLKSFGISEGVIAALKRNAFTPEKLKAPAAQTYTDKEVAQLDKANIAWSNLFDKIEKTIGKLNARFGETLVKDITGLVDKITPLVIKFAELAEKIDLVKKIGTIFVGWGLIFDEISKTIDKIEKMSGKEPPMKPEEKKAEEARKALPPEERLRLAVANEDSAGAGAVAGLAELWTLFKETVHNAHIDVDTGGKKTLPSTLPPAKPNLSIPPRVAPASPLPLLPTAAPSTTSTQHVEVKQTLNFQHEGKDAQKTADSVSKSVKEAFRQQPALAQGS